MADTDLLALVPKTKYDVEKARRIVALGWPAALPLLPYLLDWMADMNWPIAPVLYPFLAQAGLPLVPLIRSVLAGDDTYWQEGLIRMLPRCAPDVQAALRPDVEQLAAGDRPDDEDEESVWEAARDVLKRLSTNR